MKLFVRLTAGALLAAFALEATAQRVQFPTATQPLGTAPPVSTSPFAAPPVSAPLFQSPPSVYAPPPASTPVPYTPPLTSPAPPYTPPATSAPFTSPPITPLPSAPAPYQPPYPTTSVPYAAPPATPSPYSPAPGMPAPSLTTPMTPVPGAVGPPPTFDPYATGTPLGPPPPSVPYNYTPPPTNFPEQPAPLFPEGMPYQWQPGTGGSGYWATTQRLLQELSFEYTYLWGDHADPRDFEINRAELSSTFAIPMLYNIETPLLVTPGFAVNWLEGPLGDPAGVPRGPDLPPRLYDAYLDFAWYPRVSTWLGGELGFRTGVWSDFDHIDSDAVRFLGRGLASVSLTPTLDILFGAVYLDRVHVKFLPAGGFYWRPTPEWDAYVVFPNPKVRKYMVNIGNSKWYWYFAGEYGGGSWSVDRAGTSDRIDINDIRVIGGLEWETQTFIRGHIEAGYVFDREVIFAENEPGMFKPHDTIMVRGGIDF